MKDIPIIPVSWIWKLRYREVKYFVCGLSHSKEKPLSMVGPFNNSPNLDLQGKMHTFSLVTESLVTQALPVFPDLSLTMLHPDT